MTRRFFLQPRIVTGAALGLTFLVLNCITLARDVLAQDVGEWQAAGATLGIAHGPGSPAYTLITWLFSLAPIGTAAMRINFVSAVTGVIGVVAVYWLMLVLLGRLVPAVLSAVSLGVAGLWWSMSSVANPYVFVPAAMAVILALLLLWSRSGDKRLIWAGAGLAGFGLAWHPSMAFFLPVPVVGLFVLGPWRKLLKFGVLAPAAALFAAGLAFYLYLPIVSATDPPVLYEKIDSAAALVKFVSHSEKQEGRTLAHVPSPGELKDRFTEVVRQSYFPSYAFLVFGPAIILFYPSVWPRLRKIRRPLIFLLTAMLFNLAVIFMISGVYPQAQYYLPLLFYFSMWTGFSFFLILTLVEVYLENGQARQLILGVAGLIYVAVLLLGINYKWDFVNHHNDDYMLNYVNIVFSRAQPGSVVLADWETYGGLLYAQKVEAQRPDVEVISVARENWREQLSDIRARKPAAQVLFSPTLPYDPEADLVELQAPYPLGIKGRTYQDFTHGEPFPAAVMLFELKTGAVPPVI